MSDEVSDVDRGKALFLEEYKALCLRFGVMVIHLDRPEGEYSPFCLAQTTEEQLEKQLEEIRLEPVRTISW